MLLLLLLWISHHKSVVQHPFLICIPIERNGLGYWNVRRAESLCRPWCIHHPVQRVSKMNYRRHQDSFCTRDELHAHRKLTFKITTCCSIDSSRNFFDNCRRTNRNRNKLFSSMTKCNFSQISRCAFELTEDLYTNKWDVQALNLPLFLCLLLFLTSLFVLVQW